jgi:hypothetical protein
MQSASRTEVTAGTIHSSSLHRSLGLRGKPTQRIVEAFLLLEFACQVSLLFSTVGAFRIIPRTASFSLSLLLLLALPPKRPIHPAIKPAIWALAAVGVSILYPTTNTLVSGLAQFAMYVAILAPLCWVSHLRLNESSVRRTLLIIFAFQAISSLIGVLQVEFPGHFRGSISTMVMGQGQYVNELSYQNAAGQLVMRPSGLTDVPGGVCTAGFYAVLLGFYFVGSGHDRLSRIVAAAGAVVGSAAVYLSSVKAAMIELVIGALTFGSLIAWRNQSVRAVVKSYIHYVGLRTTRVLIAAVVLGAAGYFLAVTVGGEGGARALSVLASNDPGALFYHERGRFLEYGVNVLLPEYPFGAGLGRWGMMNHYFGDPDNPNSSPIWVEEQWSGWLLDGGVALIVTYALALFTALRFALKCARSSSVSYLATLGALVAAYDVVTFAATFDFVPFITQMGMDFWLLNAMLFGTATQASRRVVGRRRR